MSTYSRPCWVPSGERKGEGEEEEENNKEEEGVEYNDSHSDSDSYRKGQRKKRADSGTLFFTVVRNFWMKFLHWSCPSQKMVLFLEFFLKFPSSCPVALQDFCFFCAFPPLFCFLFSFLFLFPRIPGQSCAVTVMCRQVCQLCD